MYAEISESEARKIRFDCRQNYKETGSTQSPHPFGTIQNVVWEHEALKIMQEEMASGHF